MRIAVHDIKQLSSQGAILLLRQLGMSWEEYHPSSHCDVVIAPEPVALETNQIGIFTRFPFSGKIIPQGLLSYQSIDAFFPEEITLPKGDDFKTLGFIDNTCPGIIQRKNAFFIIPRFFEYIALSSVADKFNERFSRTFSLDCFRQIFLLLLGYCAGLLNRPLVRIWYYPSHLHTAAVCCTTDIDYKMTWDILRQIRNTTAFKAFFSRYFFIKYITRFINNAVATRYFHESYYKSIWSRRYAVYRYLGKNISAQSFFSLLSRIYYRKIPITAFIRSSHYQQEENLMLPPQGTGRKSYVPFYLEHVELGLHFGASIGELYPWGYIHNPYKRDVFSETIPEQKKVLESDLKKPVLGTRLHNEFQFNKAIFDYIEKGGFLYDSSLFGGIRKTFYSPSGTALPYYPVLGSDGNLRQARFVEIPVGVYERGKIPFKLLEQFQLPIIISQHPDSHSSNLMDSLIRYERPSWWKVHLKDLALWWHERDRVRCNEAQDGEIALENEPAHYTIVSTKKVKFSGPKLKCVRQESGERYYEPTYE